LKENTDHADEDLPVMADILSVDLELQDNAKDALSGGNKTVNIWAVPRLTGTPDRVDIQGT
jgi:hypothetical protein